MDSTAPPQVVVEQSDCTDVAPARAELRAALAPLRRPGWTVTVRFHQEHGRVAAASVITDASGHSVAERTLSSDGAECAPVARAVAVWASLVFDEVSAAASSPSPSPAPPAKNPAPPPPPDDSIPVWPHATENLPPSPEQDLILRHAADARTVEVGVDGFLMGGTGGGALVGSSLYGVFELAHGWFLRPALLAGHSVDVVQLAEADSTFLDARFDACARLPGMYREHRGIQLDLCGGTEVGASLLDPSVVVSSPNASSAFPFLGFGPSFGLRGELASHLSAMVRGVCDVSVLREQMMTSSKDVTPPLIAGRAEVGLSWSLR